MTTTLEVKKGSVSLVCKAEKRKRKRSPQAFAVPPGPISQPLTLALETVPTTNRTGIRCRAMDLADGVWTLEHAAYRGAAPGTLTWETLPVAGTRLDLLLDQPLTSAMHRFRLRRAFAGRVDVYPEASVTTPDDLPPAGWHSSPVVPASCTINITNTPPAQPDRVVTPVVAGLAADGLSATLPVGVLVDWTWADSVNPSSTLLGFRVVLYQGSDPNVIGSYVDVRMFDPGARSWAASVIPQATGNLRAAVQSLYADGGESNWRPSTGDVVITRQVLTIPKDADVRSALDQLGRIGSDAWLSMGEKPQAVREWNILAGEWPDLNAKADAASVSKTSFHNAMLALQTYLQGLSPDWANTTVDTPIDAATWKTRWADAYTARTLLQNTLTAKAQASANTALATLTAIGSDAILSAGEKPQAILEWNVLSGEWPALMARADAVSVDRTSYHQAMTDLQNYLRNLSPDWANVTVDTPIDAAAWKARWAGAYTARTSLQSAITAKAQGTADAATTRLDGMAADGVITPEERGALRAEYDQLYAAWSAVYTDAQAAGVSYSAASTAWTNYHTLVWPITQATGNSSIDATAYRAARAQTTRANAELAGACAAAKAQGAVTGAIIKTFDFAQDPATGAPIKGACLRNGGINPILVGPGGMLIGVQTATGWRAVAIDSAVVLAMGALRGTATNVASPRYWYAGNNQQGGVPDTTRMQLIPLNTVSYNACQTSDWEIRITPTGATTDNLDGLRRVEMEFYALNQVNPFASRSYALVDRGYCNLTTPGDPLNQIRTTVSLTTRNAPAEGSGYSAGCYVRARLVGVEGAGPWLWYSPATNGTVISGSVSTPWTSAPASGGSSSGGGSAGSGSIGGAFPQTPGIQPT